MKWDSITRRVGLSHLALPISNRKRIPWLPWRCCLWCSLVFLFSDTTIQHCTPRERILKQLWAIFFLHQSYTQSSSWYTKPKSSSSIFWAHCCFFCSILLQFLRRLDVVYIVMLSLFIVCSFTPVSLWWWEHRDAWDNMVLYSFSYYVMRNMARSWEKTYVYICPHLSSIQNLHLNKWETRACKCAMEAL
jgi:hypothetical protein